MIKYEAGQVLWYVPRDGRNAREVKVTSVGRKWARLGASYRVALDSTHVDGGNYASPGTLYLSKEAHELVLARARAWNKLRRCIERSWYPPEHITRESIERAAAALGFTLEEK